MSTEADKPSPADEAEALLEGWPAPSRSAMAWEDAANRVSARLGETSIGSTTDELLIAPTLPPEPGEATLALAADEPGLANIARAAMGAYSDEKDIARDGLIAAELGRQEPEAARLRPLSPNVGSVAELQGRLARPAKSGAVAGASPVTATEARSEFPGGPSRGGPGFAAGLFGGAALAFAAAAALFVTLRHHDAGAPPGPTAEVRAAASAVRAGEGASNSQQHPLALTDLPAQAEVASNVPIAVPPPEPRSVTKDALAFRVQSSPKGKVVLERREDDAPTEEAPSGAAPPEAPAAKRAVAEDTAASESAPPSPSLGAVQAALGSVMSSARNCLAGEDTGSRAELVFKSDGRVKAVTVSGPAAGTPAEACLRAALKAARVPPFSDPSYSAALTIRPP